MCSSEVCVPVYVGNLSEESVLFLMLAVLPKQSTSLLTCEAFFNLD